EVMTRHPRLTVYVAAVGAGAPPDGEQVERWIADLADEEFAVREKATAELAKLGYAAAPALRKARANQSDPERALRLQELLKRIDRIDLELIRVPEGVKVLTLQDLLGRYTSGLKSPDPRIRGHAAAGLGRLGFYTDAVIPTLTDMLRNDPDGSARSSAAGALGRLGKRAEVALPL